MLLAKRRTMREKQKAAARANGSRSHRMRNRLLEAQTAEAECPTTEQPQNMLKTKTNDFEHAGNSRVIAVTCAGNVSTGIAQRCGSGNRAANSPATEHPQNMLKTKGNDFEHAGNSRVIGVGSVGTGPTGNRPAMRSGQPSGKLSCDGT